MTEHRIGIIMNGVTGRMGTNRHLLRAMAAGKRVYCLDPSWIGRIVWR